MHLLGKASPWHSDSRLPCSSRAILYVWLTALTQSWNGSSHLLHICYWSLQVKPTWLSLGSHQPSWWFWRLDSDPWPLLFHGSLTSVISRFSRKWSFYINSVPQSHAALSIIPLSKWEKYSVIDITKLTRRITVSGYLCWDWKLCLSKILECHSNSVTLLALSLSLNLSLCDSLSLYILQKIVQ